MVVTVRFPATGFSCRIWLSPAPRKTRRGAPVKRPAEFSALSNTPVRVLHIQDALFNIYMRLQEHREREHSFVLVRCKRSWCNLFVNTFGSKESVHEVRERTCARRDYTEHPKYFRNCVFVSHFAVMIYKDRVTVRIC